MLRAQPLIEDPRQVRIRVVMRRVTPWLLLALLLAIGVGSFMARKRAAERLDRARTELASLVGPEEPTGMDEETRSRWHMAIRWLAVPGPKNWYMFLKDQGRKPTELELGKIRRERSEGLSFDPGDGSLFRDILTLTAAFEDYEVDLEDPRSIDVLVAVFEFTDDLSQERYGELLGAFRLTNLAVTKVEAAWRRTRGPGLRADDRIRLVAAIDALDPLSDMRRVIRRGSFLGEGISGAGQTDGPVERMLGLDVLDEALAFEVLILAERTVALPSLAERRAAAAAYEGVLAGYGQSWPVLPTFVDVNMVALVDTVDVTATALKRVRTLLMP